MFATSSSSSTGAEATACGAIMSVGFDTDSPLVPNTGAEGTTLEVISLDRAMARGGPGRMELMGGGACAPVVVGPVAVDAVASS